MTAKRKRQKNSTAVLLILILLLAALLSWALLLWRRTRSETEEPAAFEPTPAPSAETVTFTPKPRTEWTITPVQEPEIPEEPGPVAQEYVFRRTYQPGKDTAEADNTERFVTGWTAETQNASVSFTNDWHAMDFQIEESGSSFDDIRLYRGGIPLREGSTSVITFSASSGISRQILLTVTDGDGGEILLEKKIPAGFRSPDKTISFVSPVTTSDAWLNIRAGFDGNRDSVSAHSLHIENIRVASETPMPGARISQPGYLAAGRKFCVFPYDAGDLFDVLDEDGRIVYTGALQDKSADEYTGEYDCYGDFSPVTSPGTYRIRSQIGVMSEPFVISQDPLTGLRDDALKMLTLQRCGTALDASWAEGMSHAECHTRDAVVYQTETRLDVSGGWHDAGDYGRYTETGAKAAADLLMAYLADPGIWTDSTGIPESQNGIPDILDEVRYELEWMLKMQSEDGGVYNTVMPVNISEIVVPEEDDQDLVILFQETTSTADFAGTTALAAVVYREFDPAFAKKCLDAAKRADEYLDHNPKVLDTANPEDISGGSYRDSSDKDGRFFTKTALWAATFSGRYLEEAKKICREDPNCIHGISWNANGGYGRYLFLSAKDSDRIDPDFYEEMKQSLLYEADIIMDTVNSNSYHCSLYTYGWGSNAEALNNGIILSMAYDVSGNRDYLQGAFEQLYYVLGKNCLNTCFVTGFGYNYPEDVHSRVAKAKGSFLKGALAGGPDSYREDNLTQKMPEGTPQARMYIDSFDSWSTNEITVYYNSALLHILGRLCSIR